METESLKKMPLKRIEEKELKAFFFIGQAENIQSQEGVHIVFGYDLEKAMEIVEKQIPINMFIKESGAVPARELFKQIEGVEEVLNPKQKVDFKLPPVLPTKEQFILNLKLCANDFITDKKEKAKLLKIIEKI